MGCKEKIMKENWQPVGLCQGYYFTGSESPWRTAARERQNRHLKKQKTSDSLKDVESSIKGFPQAPKKICIIRFVLGRTEGEKFWKETKENSKCTRILGKSNIYFLIKKNMEAKS